MFGVYALNIRFKLDWNPVFQRTLLATDTKNRPNADCMLNHRFCKHPKVPQAFCDMKCEHRL
jgi:hypothetical protein